MIRNFVKVAWRNILKHKTTSWINILGLALGMTCSILIGLFIMDELSYDAYFKDADRIYRIQSNIIFGGTELDIPVTPDPMGEALKNDYPEVEAFARIYNNSGVEIRKGENLIYESQVAYVDSTFFDVFDFTSISGKLDHVLRETNSVVITRSMAEKYFGYVDAVGQTLMVEGEPFKIEAIIEDVPENTHFTFDFFFPVYGVDYPWGSFLSNNFFTYIKLGSGKDYKEFSKIFPAFIQKYVLPQAQQITDIKSMEEFEQAGNRLEYSLIPLTDIHLHSHKDFELGNNGDISNLYIFGAIAVFILLLACINFMNLVTAKSAKRAKEVGVRKILGSEKSILVGQFLTESVLLASAGMILALFSTLLLIPYFNSLTDKNIQISDLASNNFLLGILILPVVVGVIAGSYPAFYLSSMKPIQVLRSKFNSESNTLSIRNALVVFQFVTCISLIVGTMIVYKQLKYMQQHRLGFDKEQVLVLDGTRALGNNYEAFRNEMLNIPEIKNATYSGYLPIPSGRSDFSLSRESTMRADNTFNTQVWTADENYISTLGMELKMGRDFVPESDSMSLIVNETFVERLGFEDPIGKMVYGMNRNNSLDQFTIVGVVKNFNYSSLRNDIGPLVLSYGLSTSRLSLKMTTSDVNDVLNKIQAQWSALSNGRPISYRFMDEAFDRQYQSEEKIGRIIFAFSALAIFIACIGLFGLITFITEQREKEIGIRKVLGAGTASILQLMSKEFFKLILISSIIAVPLAWYGMNRWLEDFAYKINIGVWVFVLACFLTMVIAILTVGLKSYGAAKVLPVKVLRNE